MKNNSIALLGATSHIAKGIIYNFINNGRAEELVLFARSIEKVRSFLTDIQCIETMAIYPFSEFAEREYSAIINCVGFGNPIKIVNSGVEIFEVTEKFDKFIIEYLKTSPATISICLSSGAVYGKFIEPADDNTAINIFPNQILPNQYYGIAKLCSEAKHRSCRDLNIVDLRIFGYCSRFIDLDAGYLLSDIAKSLLYNTGLKIYKEDLIRDYVHPKDLYQLIQLCLKRDVLNCAVDVYSKEPISKFELLKELADNLGLRYELTDNTILNSPTGLKSQYYSKSRKAFELGYLPEMTSIQGVIEEMSTLINENAGNK